MDFSWIASLVFLLVLDLQLVTGQFGIYFDESKRNYRYYNSLPCSVNNLYTEGRYRDRSAFYTLRQDVECCYAVGSRNDCCETTSYNFVTNQFSSTCRCDPKVTCGKPPPPPKLCPSLNPRILDSLAVSNACGDFPGVFPVIRTNTGKVPPTAICNVVLAQAVVNGSPKTTLVTSEFCRRIVVANNQNNNIGVYVSPAVSIPLSQFTVIDGRDGAAFIDPNVALIQQLTSSCSQMACGLRNPNMTGKINYNDCQVLSYGSYRTSDLAQSGLRSVGVRIYPEGCRNVNILSATNTLCFTTKDQKPVLCSGDYGAPVFCKSISTNENVVVGMVAGSNICGAATSFGVVRFPTY